MPGWATQSPLWPNPAAQSAARPYCLRPKRLVFCGLFPTDADQYPDLRESIFKQVAAHPIRGAEVEPEPASAMGFGFRLRLFLGLLAHGNSCRSRLERETTLTCNS